MLKLSAIPVVKLPLVDVSTDPLDLLLTTLVLRMKQLSKINPKFIELIHDRQFRIQIATDEGFVRQIIIHNGQVETVTNEAEKADFLIQFANSEQGVKTLLKANPSAFMNGMKEGTIKMEGDFSLLVWFNRVAQLLPPQFVKPLKAKIGSARELIKQKIGK